MSPIAYLLQYYMIAKIVIRADLSNQSMIMLYLAIAYHYQMPRHIQLGSVSNGHTSVEGKWPMLTVYELVRFFLTR